MKENSEIINYYFLAINYCYDIVWWGEIAWVCKRK